MYKTFLITILCTILALPLFAQEEMTNSYVSFNGKFYIQYPADWYQVPYVNIDRYLASKKAGRPLYNYDVVLATKDSDPFFTGTYLFLTLDTIGTLSTKQVDSVVNEQFRFYGEKVRYVPVGDFMADLKSNAPSYDKDAKIISTYSTIVQNEDTLKSLLLMKKIYDHGVANFYFYTPTIMVEQNLPVFQNIVSTLNTENIEAQIPREQLKVADIDVDEKPPSRGKNDGGSNTAVYVGVGIVLMIVILRRMRKKNK